MLLKTITDYFYPEPEMTVDKIENICFKGGGIKGVAFIGVAHALQEADILPNIHRFIGSSAGAIFATAVACRMPYEKIAEIMENTDFSKFADVEMGGVVRESYKLYEYMGLHSGDYFYQWFSKILAEHAEKADITFKEIRDKWDSYLVITATDLTKKRLVYLNPDDNPDMQVRDAVRMSMSIPVFFTPVIRKDDRGLDHVYVDGGCTNNFPLNYFDPIYKGAPEGFTRTLGFNLEDDSSSKDPFVYVDQTVHINNVIDLITTLINTDIEEIQRLRLTERDKFRVVSIDTFGIASTNFNISREHIKMLIESGYTATQGKLKTMLKSTINSN